MIRSRTPEACGSEEVCTLYKKVDGCLCLGVSSATMDDYPSTDLVVIQMSSLIQQIIALVSPLEP